jgi:hypothetical protein
MTRHRPAKVVAAIVALVGLTVSGAWFMGTPYWALYRLQRAVAEHDLDTFRQYADTEAIVHNGVDLLMTDASDLVWGRPKPDDVWRGIGRRLTDNALEALRPQIQSLAAMAVDEQLQQRLLALTDTGRNSPYVELVSLDWQGAVARVTIKLSGAETPVAFTMAEDGSGHWRVVTLDAAFLKQLIQMARAGVYEP